MTQIGISLAIGCSAAGPSATYIDLATWGTFTRGSQASYMTGAPTTGATPFINVVSLDIRRFENRGDGNGTMLLLEGSRLNWFQDSESFVSWTLASATITNSYTNAPDGTLNADRVQVGSGGTGANATFSAVSITPGLDWAGSVFRRSPTGTTSAQDLLGNAAVWPSGNNALTTTYERALFYSLPNPSNNLGMWVADGRDWSASGGISAGARDEVAWGMQFERAAFASSYIPSIASAGGTTRAADILSGPISSVPFAMINGLFSFDVAPVFSSSAGIRHAADQTLFSFAEDDSERILFVVSGGSIYLRVVSGGATKVTSNALTFSTNQKLAVTVNAIAGSITVSGATSGNGTVTGTPWTRTTGSTMYVGSRQGGTQNAFVRLGPVGTAPSAKKVVLFELGQSNMQVNSITTKILSETQKFYPLSKKVEYAAGGTTLYVDWNKGTGGASYTAAIAAWNSAVTANPSLTTYTPIIVWGQGENDATSDTYAAAYQTGLNRLFNDIETDIPFFAGCKKIIHMLLPTCGQDLSPGHTRSAQIRAAETAYRDANPTLVTTIETSDLTTTDGTHYDNASMVTLSQRDGAAVSLIMGGP